MISYKELKEDALNFLQWASIIRYTWWSMVLSFFAGYVAGSILGVGAGGIRGARLRNLCFDRSLEVA